MFGQGLPCLPSCQPVHNIKKRQVAQEALPSGRVGQDAKLCAITPVQKRYTHLAASHGAFVCPRNTIRLQTSTVAKTLVSSHSGIHHIHHIEYSDTCVLWERAGYCEGIRITLNKEAVFQPPFIIF
jgi:hypothetical protein